MPIEISRFTGVSGVGGRVKRLGVVFYVPDVDSAVFVTCCKLIRIEWVTGDMVYFSLG